MGHLDHLFHRHQSLNFLWSGKYQLWGKIKTKETNLCLVSGAAAKGRNVQPCFTRAREKSYYTCHTCNSTWTQPEKFLLRRVWRYTPVIPQLRKLRQEDYCQVGLYNETLSQKIQNEKGRDWDFISRCCQYLLSSLCSSYIMIFFKKRTSVFHIS